MLRALVTISGEKGVWPGRRCMSRCAALLRACTPASVRLEIVNLTGSTDFSRLAASCGNSTGRLPLRWPKPVGQSIQGVWPGIGAADCFFPLNRSSITAHLQEVLYPNSAMITPHGRNSAAEKNRKELSVASVGAVPPGMSDPRSVHSVQASVTRLLKFCIPRTNAQGLSIVPLLAVSRI